MPPLMPIHRRMRQSNPAVGHALSSRLITASRTVAIAPRCIPPMRLTTPSTRAATSIRQYKYQKTGDRVVTKSKGSISEAQHASLAAWCDNGVRPFDPCADPNIGVSSRADWLGLGPPYCSTALPRWHNGCDGRRATSREAGSAGVACWRLPVYLAVRQRLLQLLKPFGGHLGFFEPQRLEFRESCKVLQSRIGDP